MEVRTAYVFLKIYSVLYQGVRVYKSSRNIALKLSKDSFRKYWVTLDLNKLVHLFV